MPITIKNRDIPPQSAAFSCVAHAIAALMCQSNTGALPENLDALLSRLDGDFATAFQILEGFIYSHTINEDATGSAPDKMAALLSLFSQPNITIDEKQQAKVMENLQDAPDASKVHEMYSFSRAMASAASAAPENETARLLTFIGIDQSAHLLHTIYLFQGEDGYYYIPDEKYTELLNKFESVEAAVSHYEKKPNSLSSLSCYFTGISVFITFDQQQLNTWIGENILSQLANPDFLIDCFTMWTEDYAPNYASCLDLIESLLQLDIINEAISMTLIQYLFDHADNSEATADMTALQTSFEILLRNEASRLKPYIFEYLKATFTSTDIAISLRLFEAMETYNPEFAKRLFDTTWEAHELENFYIHIQSRHPNFLPAFSERILESLEVFQGDTHTLLSLIRLMQKTCPEQTTKIYAAVIADIGSLFKDSALNVIDLYKHVKTDQHKLLLPLTEKITDALNIFRGAKFALLNFLKLVQEDFPEQMPKIYDAILANVETLFHDNTYALHELLCQRHKTHPQETHQMILEKKDYFEKIFTQSAPILVARFIAVASTTPMSQKAVTELGNQLNEIYERDEEDYFRHIQKRIHNCLKKPHASQDSTYRFSGMRCKLQPPPKIETEAGAPGPSGVAQMANSPQ